MSEFLQERCGVLAMLALGSLLAIQGCSNDSGIPGSSSEGTTDGSSETELSSRPEDVAPAHNSSPTSKSRNVILASAQSETTTATAAGTPNARPRPEPVSDSVTFSESVKPFFAKHCDGCHGADLAEGDLRLDTLAADFFSREPASQWVEVLDRLNLGEMPPKDEPRPDSEELAKVTEWITAELGRVTSLASSTGGRVVLRRLTRKRVCQHRA